LPGAGECEYCQACLTHDDIPSLSSKSQIGKCLLQEKVASLNPPEVTTVKADTPLDTAVRLMRKKKPACLLVADDSKKTIGIVTERDLVDRIALEVPDLRTRTVGEIMTASPETVSAAHPLAHAIHLMLVQNIRYLPLTDSRGEARSIVSSQNVIDFIAENCPETPA
jgi:CBS domain-containing protein